MVTLLAFALLPTWAILLLMVSTLDVAFYARTKGSSAYGKTVEIPCRRRITGREAAEAVMARAGVTDVSIEETRGHLTDHYDPMHKRLVLSSENYRGTSLAAL